MSKPREFWVAEGSYEGDWQLKKPYYQTCLNEKPEDEHGNLIHVIELSALDKKDAIIAVLKEALERHAIAENVVHTVHPKCFCYQCDLREALQKVKEMQGDLGHVAEKALKEIMGEKENENGKKELSEKA